jgi:hypothetical protein
MLHVYNRQILGLPTVQLHSGGGREGGKKRKILEGESNFICPQFKGHSLRKAMDVYPGFLNFSRALQVVTLKLIIARPVEQ